MKDWVETACLHCGARLRTPQRVLNMAELYKGKPVIFCSKICNARFVNGKRDKGIEDRAKRIVRQLSGDENGG
jgi:hypothetical protein